ncbi:hypothetical protein [Sporisorium scitamineum]|nr:hypothetical protein [Sporisorium scitamineum]
MLRLRTEAVGFQPKQAWSAWQSSQKSDPAEPPKKATDDNDFSSNPILGVRLLQRLDKLQRENDELGQLLSSGASLNPNAATNSTTSEVEELRKEVQDCHRLIQAMDKALSSAEARATASERALEVACRTNSTAIMPAKHAADGVVPSLTTTTADTDDKKPSTRNTSARKGSKPTSKSTTGGGKNSSAQQQRSNSSKPNSAAKPVGGAGNKSTQNDKPTPTTTDAKQGKNGHPSTAKSK